MTYRPLANVPQTLEDIRKLIGTTRKGWNPLENDDDSARLEAELLMHVQWMPAMSRVSVGTAAIEVTRYWDTDRQKARRIAGVLAAHAIATEILNVRR